MKQWKCPKSFQRVNKGQWKFEGKSLAGTKVCGGDQTCSLVLRCHEGRAGASDIKSFGAGWGKRELLCFPSAGCIWMRIWHCSDVCAAAIGKHELTTALPLWLNHSTPFCFLGCLAGIMRPFGIEFLALMFPTLLTSLSGVWRLLTSNLEFLGIYSFSNCCTCNLKYCCRHKNRRSKKASFWRGFPSPVFSRLKWKGCMRQENVNKLSLGCFLWDIQIIYCYYTKKKFSV